MARKGLGRGLAALIAARPAQEEEASSPRALAEIVPESIGLTRELPVDSIAPNELQPRKRFDEKGIGELVESIREKGILVPLIVSRRGEKFELVSGERRLLAAKKLGLTKVPVVFRETDSSEKLELALIENIQREDLNPVEEGMAYQELIDRFGLSQEEVAKRVGKDRTTVTNMTRLLKLGSKVREALQSGAISAGHARALLGVREPERQIWFVEKIVSEGWSVRELERRVSDGRPTLSRNRALKPISPHLVEIIDQFRRVLGTQVKVVPAKGKKGEQFGSRGKIVIDYYSEDDLDRVYRTILKN